MVVVGVWLGVVDVWTLRSHLGSNPGPQPGSLQHPHGSAGAGGQGGGTGTSGGRGGLQNVALWGFMALASARACTEEKRNGSERRVLVEGQLQPSFPRRQKSLLVEPCGNLPHAPSPEWGTHEWKSMLFFKCLVPSGCVLGEREAHSLWPLLPLVLSFTGRSGGYLGASEAGLLCIPTGLLADSGIGEASALSLPASGEAKPTSAATSKRQPRQLVLAQHCTGTGTGTGMGMLRAQADGGRAESGSCTGALGRWGGRSNAGMRGRVDGSWG